MNQRAGLIERNRQFYHPFLARGAGRNREERREERRRGKKQPSRRTQMMVLAIGIITGIIR